MSYCGQLEEFSANHSHLPIITVIPGMLFIPLYLLLGQLFSTAQLLRQRFDLKKLRRRNFKLMHSVFISIGGLFVLKMCRFPQEFALNLGARQ